MDTKPTLQTLPVDCLREIVSNLSLPECLELRTFSRHLKAAVDEHFRFVDTLPVVLSQPSSHAKGLKLEAYEQGSFNFANVTFGSSAMPSRCLTIYEDERILFQQARHFRWENFVVVPNTPANIYSFLEFIINYLPKVSKLAVIIDYAHRNMDNIEQILGVYSSKLKVLLLDKTTQSIWPNVYPFPSPFLLPERFYNIIDGFEELKELYFFSKHVTTLDMKDRRKNGERFIKKMFNKLKVFHWNSSKSFSAFQPMVYEAVEDMSCRWDREAILQKHLPDKSFQFPALKRVVCNDWSTFRSIGLPVFEMSNLETLHLNQGITIRLKTMKVLRNFPKLKRLHCEQIISLDTYIEPREYVVLGYFERVPINYTIKHLVIENLPSDPLPVETILNEVRLSLPYFAALETVTIREPIMELTVDELHEHCLILSLAHDIIQ